MRVREVCEAILKQTCSRVCRSHQSAHVDVGRGDVAVPQQTLERANVLPSLVALLRGSVAPGMNREPLGIYLCKGGILFQGMSDGMTRQWSVVIRRKSDAPFTSSLLWPDCHKEWIIVGHFIHASSSPEIPVDCDLGRKRELRHILLTAFPLSIKPIAPSLFAPTVLVDNGCLLNVSPA